MYRRAPNIQYRRLTPVPCEISGVSFLKIICIPMGRDAAQTSRAGVFT
jgi:hypothetical protein